jgi:hypothetical protein
MDAKSAKAAAKAAKAHAKALRPWYKKKRFIFSGIIVLLIVIIVVSSGTKKTTTSTASGSTASGSTAQPLATSGSSPSSPVPLGQTASVEGWTVKVISVAPEATDTATGGPPPAGYLFEVYTIQATRTDSSPESPIVLDPVLVGSTKVQRGADTNPMCYGGTPYNDQVDQGGTAQDSACISVPATDTGLVLGLGVVSQTWFATK